MAYQTVGLPEPGRCVVMGILNVTPDSFSDAGAYLKPGAAIAHGLDMHSAGAESGVGGGPTRPGGAGVCRGEIRRVVPVSQSWRALARRTASTRRDMRSPRRPTGAKAVNDVSSGLADDMMLSRLPRPLSLA